MNAGRPQMTGHGEKLSRKQDEAITALLTCAHHCQAAAQQVA